MQISEFFTWNYLATYSGAMVATMAITQFLKGPLDKAVYIPTRVLAYFAALVVLELALVFTGEFSLSGALLCFVNAIVVACSASGCVDAVRELG